MSQPVEIVNGTKGTLAKVSKRGELVVGSIEYSTPYYISVAAPTIYYEVVKGKASKRFVITSLLLASDRNFGTATTPETLTIIQAKPSDLSTAIGTIVQVDLLKNDRLIAIGLNLITEETASLVATATDSAVDVTIAGYYVDA